MPEDRRRGLLALAKAFDVPVFEDDCYADLTFNGKRPPALHALDEDGRVIYCGSFSKTVAPALRVGYLVGKEDYLTRAIQTYLRAHGTSSNPECDEVFIIQHSRPLHPNVLLTNALRARLT